MKVKEIPKLAEGEKIHIDLGGGKKSKIVNQGGKKNQATSTPVLLKKPPKFTAEERNIRLSMGDMDLDADHESHSSSESEGAVARSVVSDFSGFSDSDNNDDDWNDFQQADAAKT